MRNIICLLYTPQPGTKPATQARTLTENWTSNLSHCGMTPNHLSHMGQGWECFDYCFNSTSCNLSIRFSDSSWFSFGRLFLGICPFLPDCQFVVIQLFVIFSYNPLYLFGVSCYFSSFSSDFIYLAPLFFWMGLVGLPILFIFWNNHLLVSLVFCIFLDSILFISSLVSIIFFSVCTWGFFFNFL